MKIVRKSVFETNSSSSHSLSLCKSENLMRQVPKNTTLDVIKEFKSDSYFVMTSEFTKLYMLVQIISTYIYSVSNSEFCEDYRKKGKNPYVLSEEDAKTAFEEYKSKILGNEWLVWLKEVIKEECNTDLIFGFKSVDFPFICEMSHYDDLDIIQLLGVKKDKVLDKESIKVIFKNIIFNPSVYFYEEVNEW